MPHETALPTALEAFETCLETPIVPGELQTWVANAQKSCAGVVATLKQHVPIWHKPVIEQIGRQDPELATRVKQLRDEDAALLRRAQQVNAEADSLAADASELASHDPRMIEEVRKFIDSGLKWIIRIRRQEAALTTWYQESFNRDRGVVD